jgi:hypothetical protein
MEDYVPRPDPDKCWGVYLEENGWYAYGWRGEPMGPYDTQDEGWNRLDDYATDPQDYYNVKPLD